MPSDLYAAGAGAFDQRAWSAAATLSSGVANALMSGRI
jgi:hypothetical protein